MPHSLMLRTACTLLQGVACHVNQQSPSSFGCISLASRCLQASSAQAQAWHAFHAQLLAFAVCSVMLIKAGTGSYTHQSGHHNLSCSPAFSGEGHALPGLGNAKGWQACKTSGMLCLLICSADKCLYWRLTRLQELSRCVTLPRQHLTRPELEWTSRKSIMTSCHLQRC